MAIDQRMPQKFTLSSGSNTLQVPGGLCGSHLEAQAGALCLWTTANLSQRNEEVEVYVAVTGEILPFDTFLYLGTALLNGGGFVLHAYQVLKEQ